MIWDTTPEISPERRNEPIKPTESEAIFGPDLRREEAFTVFVIGLIARNAKVLSRAFGATHCAECARRRTAILAEVATLETPATASGDPHSDVWTYDRIIQREG